MASGTIEVSVFLNTSEAWMPFLKGTVTITNNVCDGGKPGVVCLRRASVRPNARVLTGSPAFPKAI